MYRSYVRVINRLTDSNPSADYRSLPAGCFSRETGGACPELVEGLGMTSLESGAGESTEKPAGFSKPGRFENSLGL
ncbi:hypothetical protein JW835_06570 [bacterium]|nr:hypothetical protein [bacterium]